jgi:hypothetical protein
LNPNDPADQQRSFQYVSVLETFKLLVSNQGYKRQALAQKSSYVPTPDMVQDVLDGDWYKSSPVFSNNPGAIPIFMYSDAACLINPLNTGRTKVHKVTGFYFTFASLPAWNRSKCDTLHIAIMVKEVDLHRFGYDLVLKPLIEDLKKLEEGVDVEGYDLPVKGGLGLWLADNLGAHELSGLSSCFSSGNICRTCIATFKEIKEGRIHNESFKEGPFPLLSREMYNLSAFNVDLELVKKPCPLNVLDSFHCIQQCPPCHAHDILEGVAAYDILGYLKILIKERKMFTLDMFNVTLKNFDFTKYNSKDIPPSVTIKNKNKLSMSAGQMRVFLRYIAMIITPLCDTSDPVFEQIVRLAEVFNYIASPRLHLFEIVDMQNIIHLYLEECQNIMGNEFLRPKHHFLGHYADNYKHYGPLNNSSTLRFESKHRFSKDTVHKAKNFKNVLQMLAVRHQRLQSHLFYSGLFSHDFEIHGDAISVLTAISDCPSDDMFSLSVLNLARDHSVQASLCKSVSYRSLKYEPGLLVVISQQRFDDLMTVGRILKCFVDGQNPGFIVRRYEAVKNAQGYYETFAIGNLSVQLHSSLLDPTPLIPIKVGKRLQFALHHYVSAWR